MKLIKSFIKDIIQKKKKNIQFYLKKKYIISIFFLIIELLILSKLKVKNLINIKKIDKKSNIKVCICTAGKNENKYIREFVEYYINFGVDKIFLYDNNDLDGERFEVIINDYIKKGLVKIMNWRGKKSPQLYIMNHCYNQNYNQFGWLIFYDIDEFIFLNKFKNIKNFLSQSKFKRCKIIQLNWVRYTDNNLIHYANNSIIKRFSEKEKNARINNENSVIEIKSIIRGYIPKLIITCAHRLTDKFKGCDGFGRKSKLNFIKTVRPDYKYYYIKHYYSKSLEEFIQKLKRSDIYYGYQNITFGLIERYFDYNQITLYKINIIERETHLNLSKFRKKINFSKI